MVRSYCPLCQIVIPPTLIDGHAQAWPRHRLVRVAEPSPETLALLDATFDQPIDGIEGIGYEHSHQRQLHRGHGGDARCLGRCHRL